MSRPTLRTIARLLAPWRTIRRLERRNKLLSDALANPTLTGIAIHKQQATMGFACPGAQMIAGMFMGLLQDNLRAKAEQEARNLRAELARLQGDPEAHY